jgi:hypothetical protein
VLSVRHRLTGSDYPIGIFKFFLWTLSNERLDINQGLSIECWKTTTLPINILLSVINPDFQNKDLFRTYIHTNVLPPVATWKTHKDISICRQSPITKYNYYHWNLNNGISAIKSTVCFFYFNLCLHVRLYNLSYSFTSISFLLSGLTRVAHLSFCFEDT